MADTCAGCGAAPGSSAARWCGNCGTRLGPPDPRRARRARTAAGADHAMVGAGSTALLVDDRPEPDEVVPTAPTWSPRARLAAAAGVLLVLVGVLVLRPEPEVTYDARGYTARGDANRSGVVSLAPLPEPTGIAWEVEVGAGRTTSNVRAAGDLVLEQTGGGLLAVRDAATGEVRWLRRDLGPAGRAVRVGDVVVVPSETGPLRGFDATDGTERWRVDDVGAAGLFPAGEDVLVRTRDRTRSVVAATGAVRWDLDDARAFDGTVQSMVPGGAGLGVWITSPAGLPVDSPRVSHRVALLEPATGAERFSEELGATFGGGVPVAVGARSVAWIARGTLTVAAPDGRVVHRLPDVGGTAVAATGDLLAIARSGGIVGLDLRTGTERWDRPDVTTDGLVATDGLVIASNGTLIDADTGRTLSNQHRLTFDAVIGETTLLSLPAIAGTELEIRDRGGATVVATALVPDESAAPAVGADRVFVPTRDGVEAFRVADGTRDWSFAQLPTGAGLAGGQATARTPAVADTTVLVSPGNGFGGGPGLVALELGGGVRTWDREGDAPIVRGPLTLAGDTAFVPVGGEVHGYDVRTGRRAFAAVAGTRRGALVVSPNRVIGGPALPVPADATPEAVAILRRDRSENWRVPLHPCSGPVLAGERVAWGTADGVTALHEATGEPAWTFESPRPVCLDPVAAGGSIVAVVEPATLLALDAASGATRWTAELPSPPVAAPVVAGGQLLVPLLDGTLGSWDLDDGAPRWSFGLGGTPDASPTVLGDRVLVHLRDGRFRALAP